MDLKTKYMGMTLRSPLVVSASPLSEYIQNIKMMEDAGAGAVVLYSLFEEQIRLEQHELHFHTTHGTESYAESLSYFPDLDEYKLGPEEYLNHIRKAKESVKIPIIASLNGSTLGGWTDYAKEMAKAGADAIELNIYYIPSDMELSGGNVEQTYIDILRAVKSAVDVPVAIKLSPYFSNMANMARRFDDAGANALVLFNRFYQPDIDLEEFEVVPNVQLSTSSAMRLPMRWIAILKDKIAADLAATSGVHTGLDAVKMLLVGANVAMICSALLKHGIFHLQNMEKHLVEWMEKNGYNSVEEMIGIMSQQKTADPSNFERAQYMKALTYYKL
ncbi:MAG TPA: dihydroorotate dehydrogenase-like protein [Cyclobacteriaceae bacterium]|nr:dihydroorotate dehydrogenase-like protein [Cyclobacteriaceae bacterium]